MSKKSNKTICCYDGRELRINNNSYHDNRFKDDVSFETQIKPAKDKPRKKLVRTYVSESSQIINSNNNNNKQDIMTENKGTQSGSDRRVKERRLEHELPESNYYKIIIIFVLIVY